MCWWCFVCVHKCVYVCVVYVCAVLYTFVVVYVW